MESRFATLRQRDSSVSMLRVKLSRRRSQCQKENRGKAVNSRRQLEKLSELDQSTVEDASSVLRGNVSVLQEKAVLLPSVTLLAAAQLERTKQLERWKERKVLEKEKGKREKERRDIFKTGLYHPKDTFKCVVLPQVPKSKARTKEAAVQASQPKTTRVTRSLRRQQQQTLKVRHLTASLYVEPVGRASSTRSAGGPPVSSVPKTKDKQTAGTGVIGTSSVQAAYGRMCRRRFDPVVESSPAPTTMRDEEEKMLEDATAGPLPVEDPSSFAPQGFMFQGLQGLSTFQFVPLTPCSADSFLRPSFPPQDLPLDPLPHTSPTPAPQQAPLSPQEPEHNVPYFRLQMSLETEKLTGLSQLWECRVEDQSIPEEMRERMRTAVGQAGLLMKERFGQFSGLVDDCELGRGEKITTCTDLQGFWDMVYYQVEDVDKKFAALKEAESRNWEEELEKLAAPRQKKAAKIKTDKKPAGAAKPSGASTAVKARLAAAKAAMKAAMKAKKQAFEAEKASGNTEEDCTALPQEAQSSEPRVPETVLFQGGFFQVESPAKLPGSPRRSSPCHDPRQSPCCHSHQNPCCHSHQNPCCHSRQSPCCHSRQSPCCHSRQSPAATPARAPAATPAKTPAATPARAPAATPARAPAATPAKTPAATPAKTPAATPARAPAATPARAPATTPARITRRSQFTLCPTPSGSPGMQSPEEQPEASVVTSAPSSPASQVPEAHSLSFSLSPCPGHETPARPAAATDPSHPTLPSPPMIQVPIEEQESMIYSPDNSVVENVPGLDFERYLQPSERRSSSIRAVQMESPGAEGDSGDLLPQDEALSTPAGLHAVSSLCTPQSKQAQPAKSDLLLFTPDLRDRIRASMCPSDLMVFTPPNA
ncbi:hypothetical protein NHX12_025592 [Muraenolepis orangiensis]|uniref:Disks large-associated protein 5 n=1 Tax=Muraenolepis orangiensis TaxID=630683 RepID=A0A9Q0ISF4_9TELE|nr:hypothetical protein NHX12_025592 [Muraenolepis orangiensis]